MIKTGSRASRLQACRGWRAAKLDDWANDWIARKRHH